MCGINGIVGIKDAGLARQLVSGMNDCLNHRGPDDHGLFVAPGVALGHRRLSIIDLSAAGQQPMTDADNRFCITFNGEIYNFASLKKQLNDYPFTTQTDTEVLLAAYKRWGKDCLHKLDGMFAFAIWDKSEQELFVARDRLGIKPLYYYKKEEQLLFSSEIRSMLASGIIPKKLNNAALNDYLRYQTVHAPATIIENIQMLMPGHFLVYKDGHLRAEEYWSITKNNGEQFDVTQSYDEVTDHVGDLLNTAVEERLMADVPFGAFLSGGIDSSVIVGLMSRLCEQKVNTFSVSFDEQAFDESKYARLVADKFDTNHTEIRLQPDDFLRRLPEAMNAMDHPSGDGPNTYIVSSVTKEAGITVALSGLGGDEVFAGYDTFKRMKKLSENDWVLKLPGFSRAWAGNLLKQIKPGTSSAKLSEVLTLPAWDMQHTYPITRQVLEDDQLIALLNGSNEQANRVQEIVEQHQTTGNGTVDMPTLSKVSVAEISTYMQNVLLRDTDQMSMASALEVRVPFLDYQLIEYVLSVPDNYKYPHTPKKLLIDSLNGLLPDEVINRPKMGFTLPWERWLKNDLKAFSEEHLQLLGAREEFNNAVIQDLWQSFNDNNPKVGWARIWILVVLGYWLEQQGIEG